MTSPASFCVSCIVAGMLIASASDAPAQGLRSGGPPPQAAAQPPQTAPLPSDPLTGPVVTKAPYSGDAVTTVTQVLMDGTRIEERTEARFNRDSAGRIRREQTILGLPQLNPAAQPQTVVTIDPTPEDDAAYQLDPVNRTARRVSRAGGPIQWITYSSRANATDLLLGARTGAYALTLQTGDLTTRRVARQGTAQVAGAKQSEESLGTRQIEGVRATGRKTTSVIPTGQIGNDRPIEITDERWESPDLKVVVYSKYSDPRSGIVEFRLTNINRSEPQPDLFTVPTDYTIVEPGAPGLRTGGARQGGGLGRGAQ
jgi:hypothetical protein